MAEIDPKELTTIKYAQGLAAKVIGGLVGGGTALITVNPVLGAVVGATVAHTLETVGKEVIERHLTVRQEVRVGRAVAIAFGKLKEFAEEGKHIRDDDFFRSDDENRSVGAEVTEATLYAAMNSAEEKKVDFIASLLANIATSTSIDGSTAHLLIAQAERLTFRSFILLKIIGDRAAHPIEPRNLKGDDDTIDVSVSLAGLEVELYGFVQSGLVEMKDGPDAKNSYAILGADNIDPGRLFLSSFGKSLYDNLGLTDLAEDREFNGVLADLRQLGRERRAARVIDNGEF